MELSPQGIPIIDFSSPEKSITDRIADACTNSGCFYIKNHGIDIELTNRVFRDLKTFFSQPTDEKLFYVDSTGNLDRGYEPFETRNVNAFMGRLGFPNDPIEKYAFGPMFGSKYAENIWPRYPKTLKENIENFYDRLKILAEKLMNFFSIAVGAPDQNYFRNFCGDGEHILRANFYPKSEPKPMQTTRIGEHTDGTPFTILITDDSRKSLQIKNSDGDWIYADPVAGSIFVNLGDFMAIWTNDRWKATVHRVVWPENGEKIDERISLAYFIQMNPGAVVECLPSCVKEGEKPNYGPTSYADYVKARMNRLSGRY